MAHEPLSAHDRDKVLAILKSLSASCGTQRGSGDHAWRKCRHCLAQQETDHDDVRELIRRFVSEIDSAAFPHAEAPPTPALTRLTMFEWTDEHDVFTGTTQGVSVYLASEVDAREELNAAEKLAKIADGRTE